MGGCGQNKNISNDQVIFAGKLIKVNVLLVNFRKVIISCDVVA